MTPAEEISAAAKLMRERAAEAEQEGFGSTHPGKPWCPSWTYSAVRHVERNLDMECSEHPWGSEKEGDCNQWGRYAGPHIAGMHPGVGLALADLLDKIAWAIAIDPEILGADLNGKALAIARAYLGSTDA